MLPTCFIAVVMVKEEALLCFPHIVPCLRFRAMLSVTTEMANEEVLPSQKRKSCLFSFPLTASQDCPETARFIIHED